MNIFNSLGSNYDLPYVIKSLFQKDAGAKKSLTSYLEKRYEGTALLTYKGREAITLALETLQLSENSGVAVNAFTCIAVIQAIENAKLTPVYIDIDPSTLNFTPDELEKSLKHHKISVVIIQNTLGYPCDIEGILKVCKKHNLILIEDLAHSIGTIYANKTEAGKTGDFAILSFSQDKVVDSVSGGALIIRNQKYKIQSAKKPETHQNSKDKMYPLLTFLIRKTYPYGIGKILHKFFKLFHLLSDPMGNSSNTQLTDWHAMLTLAGYSTLEKNLQHKRSISKIYAESLDKKILSQEICKNIDTATCLRFPIFVSNRKKLIEQLKTNGVHISDIWYDSVVAPKKYLGLARYPKSTCPNGEKVADLILNLPTHINVTGQDALEISKFVNSLI